MATAPDIVYYLIKDWIKDDAKYERLTAHPGVHLYCAD